ncbi:MAG TPA: GMC oxidoreductase, partial [Solirubrobacteraceae bacterium]|nr:GMC oxidoreductase [Solirubrobacteraceae bacterium]
AVNTVVDRVELEGGRAAGVVGRGFEARAGREVILATGAIATPKILQLSGIGPADTLRSAGVDVVVDSPNVGARLREHRVFLLQFRLAEDLGHNKLLGTEAGQEAARRQYQATRQGPLATPQCEIVGFLKTRPELDRPDAQIQIGQFSLRALEPGKAHLMEREPGMLCLGFILRPDSEGGLHVTSPDPDAPLDIDANYFATEHDRTTAVDLFRSIRRLFATAPLAGRIEHETLPGSEVQADQEIIDAGLAMGACGYHAIATCAMGPGDDDVVDPRLRVRGVEDLRVVDASVLPIMVAGNLSGPVSALAWRAADFIVDGS